MHPLFLFVDELQQSGLPRKTCCLQKNHWQKGYLVWWCWRMMVRQAAFGRGCSCISSISYKELMVLRNWALQGRKIFHFIACERKKACKSIQGLLRWVIDFVEPCDHNNLVNCDHSNYRMQHSACYWDVDINFHGIHGASHLKIEWCLDNDVSWHNVICSCWYHFCSRQHFAKRTDSWLKKL